MKIHNDIEQGSEAWHRLRAGRLTASKADAIGNAGKGLETQVIDTVARKLSSAMPESYTNEDMERGNELESLAIDRYEDLEGVKAEIVGFVESDDGLSGCSPDRFIDDDKGMIQVKCPNDVNFLKLMLAGKDGVDSKYVWQMNMEMLICEREYNIFLAYNPNFKESLIAHRFEKDPEKQEKLKIGIKKGGDRIKEIENMLK